MMMMTLKVRISRLLSGQSNNGGDHTRYHKYGNGDDDDDDDDDKQVPLLRS